jgi:hypothetical protein
MKKISLAVLLVVLTTASTGFPGVIKSGWTIFKKVQSPNPYIVTICMGVRGDLSGMFYNPAVLASGDFREVLMISEVGSTGDTFLGLVYGEPFSRGMLAGGIVYYNAGKMDLNWLENGALKTSSVTAQQDLIGILSYGHRVLNNLFAGATIKLASSQVAERSSAIAFAGDLGILYMPSANVAISAGVQNLGGSTKFVAKNNPLPQSIFLGNGYSFQLKGVHLLPSVGFTCNLADDAIIPDLGLGIGYGPVSLNFGYRFNVEEANLSFGAGFVWRNFDIGYAFVPGFTLNPSHRFSLGYRFEKPQLKPVQVLKPQAKTSPH